MHFLKALSLFILLISGSAGIAFSFPQEDDRTCDEQEISLQVSEDISELFESTLVAPDISGLYLTPQGTTDFYFQSILAGVEAERYIASSRFIDPALDVSEIIFPFHFFL